MVLYEFFFSPQVKRSVIISNKHGMYKLLHELPNKVRISILRNWEILGKFQKIKDNNLAPGHPPKGRIYLVLAKNC